ncbi:hypothetical protein [Pseudomonas sp. W03]|uniref:hypothetical protein n=1 Tax=Pseudomonas sp. W03 TaxID=3090666 RepID=UPI003A4E32A0
MNKDNIRRVTKQAIQEYKNNILANVFQNDPVAYANAAGQLYGIDDLYSWHQKLESLMRDYQREIVIDKTTEILEKKYAQH